MPLPADQQIPDDKAIRLWNSFDDILKADDNFQMGIDMPQWLHDAHNTRSGRAFIFGTGPSLIKQLPLLAKLKDEQTWTCNRMQRWTDLPFTPTHHCITEPGPVLDWGRAIHPEYDYPTALNRIAIHWVEIAAPGWLWCPKAYHDVQIRWEGFFGLGDSLPPLPSGWASPLTMSQLAAWIGHTELIFLGIDSTQEGQAWDAANGRTMHKRALSSIMEGFDRAKHQIEKAGRKIYDCTPGGLMNTEGILEYVELGDVLGTPAK